MSLSETKEKVNLEEVFPMLCESLSIEDLQNSIDELPVFFADTNRKLYRLAHRSFTEELNRKLMLQSL